MANKRNAIGVIIGVEMVLNDANVYFVFFFQAEDGIRDPLVTGVQTCALPIFHGGMWKMTSSPGSSTVLNARTSALDAPLVKKTSWASYAMPSRSRSDRAAASHAAASLSLYANQLGSNGTLARRIAST